MKRLACVCTVLPTAGDPNSSANLVALYNDFRVYNSEHGIKGAFLIAGNSSLQIYEGETGAIGRMFYRICRDERIGDIGIVVNRAIEIPAFSNWSIRFIRSDSDRHQSFMQRIRLIIGDDLDAGSSLDRQRLDLFFARDLTPAGVPADLEAVSGPAGDQGGYQGRTLSLSGWPKPSQMRLDPSAIRLCSRLVATPVAFEKLDAREICGSEQALVALLDALDRLGVLIKHEGGASLSQASSLSKPVSAQAPASPEKLSSDRFSRVLRKFLATAKPENG